MKISFLTLSLLVLSATACSNSDSKDSAETNGQENVVPAPGTDNAQGAVGDNTEAPGTSVTDDTTPPDEATVVPPAEDVEPAEVIATEVDATVQTSWAYLDLDTLKVVAETDASWDLAFKRTAIKMNADVKALVLKDTTFDAIAKAPQDIYAGDVPAGTAVETDGLFFHTPEAWYSYDINVHVISSRNFIYVVKSNGGQDIKLAITDYYNADRLPAYIQLKTQVLGQSAAAE